MESKPPLPPFTLETAKQKIQAAEDAWNTRDPERVSLAYTTDSEWRNRSVFLSGREAIKVFLQKKWDSATVLAIHFWTSLSKNALRSAAAHAFGSPDRPASATTPHCAGRHGYHNAATPVVVSPFCLRLCSRTNSDKTGKPRLSGGCPPSLAYASLPWRTPEKELDYRLKKELWSFMENRIAVRFEYEWHDDSGQWFRSYGNENWEFADNGLMRYRFASINDLPIKASERKHLWQRPT